MNYIGLKRILVKMKIINNKKNTLAINLSKAKKTNNKNEKNDELFLCWQKIWLNLTRKLNPVCHLIFSLMIKVVWNESDYLFSVNKCLIKKQLSSDECADLMNLSNLYGDISN